MSAPRLSPPSTAAVRGDHLGVRAPPPEARYWPSRLRRLPQVVPLRCVYCSVRPWPVIRASLTIVSVMTDEQETISDAALEDQADITALTGVLPGPDGPLPLLILDQRPEMAVRSAPAERVNLSVSALLSMGLTLVTTISEAGPGTPDVIEVGEPRSEEH